jgi:hypothetical protein
MRRSLADPHARRRFGVCRHISRGVDFTAEFGRCDTQLNCPSRPDNFFFNMPLTLISARLGKFPENIDGANELTNIND